jgi:hypothetical protein
MSTPKVLDAIADKVLRYRPKAEDETSKEAATDAEAHGEGSRR